MEDDLKHLRLLSIFYYVFAGFSLLGGLLNILIFSFIRNIMLEEIASQPDVDEAEVEQIIEMATTILFVTEVFSVCLSCLAAILSFLAARFLVRHVHRTFCLVIAFLACLNMPLGTILGVFTIAVLGRDSVKQLFAGQQSPSPPQAQ